jgi:hypothetical protein
MRTLLTFIALLIASPAFAMSESALNFCKSMKDPMQCVSEFLTAEREARQERVALEVAEIQASGMAAFGSGFAMINGVNQGLATMRVQPYSVPFQPVALPFPQAGR